MGICVSCRRRERKAPEKRSLPGAGAPVKGAVAAELLPRRLDRLPTMANSMSNIKMSNPIKGMVSRRRRRYQKDGFNLDLAYITDRLIAMGFPAEKLEGVYRNHIDEVLRFLETMHRDHYRIYNLCSERSYDHSKFHNRVGVYAFEDHTPPKIEIIQPFCEDVHKWLNADPRNVAAVHCKAGKGRTGTMVCCYLLYSQEKETADDALNFYGTKRTLDDKGVTIPSQRRYVEYYSALLRSRVPYIPSKVHVRELVMSPPPALAGAACCPELTITQADPSIKAPAGCAETERAAGAVRVRLTHCTPLVGDVRVDVYNKPKMKMRKEKLFHFWFNTFFVTAGIGAERVPPLHDSPNLETFKLTLDKWQLDEAHKDKQHKHYSEDFRVELIVQKMPESSTFRAHAARSPSPPSSTASSCSEPEPDTDGHWDSGELPYSRLLEPYPSTLALHTHSFAAGDLDRPNFATEQPDSPNFATGTGDSSNFATNFARADLGCPNFAAGARDSLKSTTAAGDCSNSATGDLGCPNFSKDERDSPNFSKEERDSPNFATGESDSLYQPSTPESDCFAAGNADNVYTDKDFYSDYYKLSANTAVTETADGYYKLATNGKKSEGIKTRLSLGDVRASWREFSGKFGSDSRKKKDGS